MGENPSEFRGASRPVEQVSWNDALRFCKRLSHKAGKTVRLPTEAQWEYACRAGSSTRFSFGDDEGSLHLYANYCDASNTNAFPWQDKDHTDGHNKTAPCGSLLPNTWGLHDMHGNVSEWCRDGNAGYRFLRGGSWSSRPRHCRSAKRNGARAVAQGSSYGFRVVVSLSVGRGRR